jgi:hypothetical protein
MLQTQIPRTYPPPSDSPIDTLPNCPAPKRSSQHTGRIPHTQQLYRCPINRQGGSMRNQASDERAGPLIDGKGGRALPSQQDHRPQEGAATGPPPGDLKVHRERMRRPHSLQVSCTVPDRRRRAAGRLRHGPTRTARPCRRTALRPGPARAGFRACRARAVRSPPGKEFRGPAAGPPTWPRGRSRISVTPVVGPTGARARDGLPGWGLLAGYGRTWHGPGGPCKDRPEARAVARRGAGPVPGRRDAVLAHR